MKWNMRRILAWLLIIALCIGLLSGVIATVSAASYVANWGHRGVIATDLSESAVAFYDAGHTYDDFMALTGTDVEEDLPETELFQALKAFMIQNHTHVTDYDETKALYRYTDCQDGNTTGPISSFYTGLSIGPAWDGGASWNQEHCWPQSKGGSKSEDSGADIIMLRPTAKSENSSRGNTTYGEGSGYFDPSDMSSAYDTRGDVARVFLYTYLRWDDSKHREFAWGEDGVMESREVLLKWMEADPVDTWELGRNDAVESITGTRNVFVDYPELAFQLLGAEVPSDMPTPSGEAMSLGTSQYAITAVSSDNAQGTVSVSGRVLHAVPAQGYHVGSVTVLEGIATVEADSQNPNRFIIQAESDCTVLVQFVSREEASVLYYADGEICGNTTAYMGDDIILPATAPQMEGATFLGWSEVTVENATSLPAYHPTGSTYTVTGDTALYALYSCLDTTGEGSNPNFTLHTGALTPGDYLITYVDANQNVDAVKAEVNSGGRLNYDSLEKNTDGTITTEDGIHIWTITAKGSGYSLENLETGKYLTATGKNKGGLSATDSNTNTHWKVTGTDVYEFTNVSTGRLLRKNGGYGFAAYSSSTGGPLTLYKRVAGSLMYTTGQPAETHTHTPVVQQSIAATCTGTGLTEGSYCSGCGEVLTPQEEIPALGHTFEGLAGSDPTCTEDGHIQYSCVVCWDPSYDYTEILPATGHSWNDGEITTPPTEETSGILTYTCALCGENKTQDVPVLEHVHSYTAVVTPPTCTEEGYTTYTCRCGDSYTQDPVDALGHTFEVCAGDYPTCTEDGMEEYACVVCWDPAVTYQKVIPATGHKEVIDAAVSATCTESGLTEGKHCSVCGEVTVKQEVIDALGHSEVIDEAVAATCTETGLTEGMHCSVCNELLAEQEEIPALGHNYEYGICANCGAEQPAFVLGDVNGNGQIDNYDLLLILYHTNKRVVLQDSQFLAADINGNGEVNVWDIQRMVLFLNKRIDSLS